jgi:hypothetical protein
MKYATVLCAILAAATMTAFGAGLVKNSDFSSRDAGNPLHVADWKMPAGEPSWSVTDADGHSGKDALRYQADGERNPSPVTQEVPCQSNTEYVLSAWLKSDGVLRPLVRVIAPDLSDARVTQVVSDGSKAWSRFATRFNSGNAKRLLIQIFASTESAGRKPVPPGRADVDDVQITPAAEVPASEAVVGGFQPKPPGENIALGKTYTLSPRPNYSYCTDADDKRQLTDGQYTVGYFWTQHSTVGWQHASPAIITLDLGSVQPICGVSYNTAAGVAQVTWPLAITLLVSGDGKNYHVTGELVSLSASHGAPPPEGYATHRYWTDQLKTHGRYISFVISPSGPYHFVDEIEVYKGDPALLNLALTGEPVSDIRAFFQTCQVHLGVQRRLRQDILALRESAQESGLAPGIQAKLVAELDAIEKEIPHLPSQYDMGFRAILPLNPLHERIFRAQAMLWRAFGIAPVGGETVWQSPLWDPLSHTAAPPKESKAEVSVAMMQNEYRAGAFNVSNASENPLSLRLQITGLPGGANPPYITVHEVAWTDTKGGTPVAAALPEAKRDTAGFAINVPSGLTRQVWLTFHPKDIEPGAHRGEIVLSGDAASVKVPLTLRIFPLRFPDEPTLHLGGWDYTDSDHVYDITSETRDAVIAHLREHFVDSPWASAAVLTPGEYDAQGNMTAEPDTARFDRWLLRWPGARQYCVFASVGKSFANSRIDTPDFAKKVGGWIDFWTRHAQELGVKPEQICILLVDEPTRPEQDETILAWAKAIRAANTGVKIWEDTCHADPAKANQEMMAACHVLCPNRPAFLRANDAYRDYYVKRRDQGCELAFYSCSGPARLLDPYAYHRLQAWSAWQYGAKASYFWAFSDSGGGSSWNEYASARSAYVPFFLDPTTVTPGKHMEAVRESVEDYEYLVMLRDRIAQAEKKGVTGDALDRAKNLLAEAANRVCNAEGAKELNWADPKDRTLADKVRIELLEAITELQERLPK